MQVIFSFGIQLAAFYILYSASNRAVFHRGKFSNWLSGKRVATRIAGFLLLLFSFPVVIIPFGIAIGILITLITCMTVFSCMIIIIPLMRKQRNS